MDQLNELKQKIKELEAEVQKQKLRAKFFEIGGIEGLSKATGESNSDFFVRRYSALKVEDIEAFESLIKAEIPSIFAPQTDSKAGRKSWAEAMRDKGYKVG